MDVLVTDVLLKKNVLTVIYLKEKNKNSPLHGWMYTV